MQKIIVWTALCASVIYLILSIFLLAGAPGIQELLTGHKAILDKYALLWFNPDGLLRWLVGLGAAYVPLVFCVFIQVSCIKAEQRKLLPLAIAGCFCSGIAGFLAVFAASVAACTLDSNLF